MIKHLEDIHGIGPVLAKTIWKSFHKKPKTKKALYKMLYDQLDNLPVAAQVDLIEQPESVTWEEIDHLNDVLRNVITGIKWEIAGGYRRGKPISNDIDIVVSKGRRVDVWNTWMEKVSILEPQIIFQAPYAQGPSKLNLIINLYGKKVRVDIFLVKPREWIFALLYATGSGQFNIMMRSVAKKKGYTLNQKCLVKDTGECLFMTERQLFKFLELEWVPPHERND